MEADPIQTPMLDELRAELAKMRRSVADFSVLSLHQCKFCPKPKSAYHLINAKFGNHVVGSWCGIHGWLFFDSVALPPTERLYSGEIADNRDAERRRQKVAQRKAATTNRMRL